MINGLSQTLLKITVPGVPDFYQGSELWDLRMVDPDNRGAIDFATRRTALEALANADNNDSGCAVCGLLNQWHDGRVKLYLIWKSIRSRRDHDDLFRQGEFIPLKAQGVRAKNVTAFLRRREASWALIAIPKWLSQLTADDSRGTKEFDWQDTRLVLPTDAPLEWNSVITRKKLSHNREDGGSSVLLHDLFREFPVAFNYSQTP
jgi:(1->4)-alpha-D-glucan 1-alpha-D-glucosylmutase